MIIHADCYEWAKEQPDKSIDHIITDYEYGQFFPFAEFVRICRGTILTFCSDKDDPLEGNRTEIAYWIKTPSTKNTVKHLSRFVEQIHIFRQSEYDVFNTDLHWSNYTGVYTDVVEEKGWLWKKPLSLMERLVRIYTSKGDIVVDPYCGSGTTLQACYNHGRSYIGIDIDWKWVDYCKENIK
jgi:DNA modification methylase